MSKSIYLASDYAGLITKKWDFYYGYEETQDDEWCFVAWDKDNKEIARYKASEFAERDGESPEIFLLEGLAKFLDENA